MKRGARPDVLNRPGTPPRPVRARRPSETYVERTHSTLIFLGALAQAAAGCAVSGPAPVALDATDDVIAAELESMTAPQMAANFATFRRVLDDALGSDPYVCRPSAREVFFGRHPPAERQVRGQMPHYGLFWGPMSYRVRRLEGPQGWEVNVRVAVDAPAESETLELPDCALRQQIPGPMICEGVAYEDAAGREACPGSGTFQAKASYESVRALLAWWSREAEALWNRDALRFALPVRYRFHYVRADEDLEGPADLRVPLSPTCGRTPYFSSFRAGWSIPIVAHETGHVLGLLDEYEPLSGIVAAYPKTPFAGAEVSRMGLSMRRDTIVLPIHHYLVLRRWFCQDPPRGGPFAHLP